MKYDVFFSYSHKDEKLVRSLTEKMRDREITYFFASESLAPGFTYTNQITEAIKSSYGFLMLVTESYLQSLWTEKEATYALDLAKKSGLRILPIVTAPEKLSSKWKNLIGDTQYITGSFEEASDKAVAVLAEEKKEQKKAEILNRAYESWNYGDFYTAELDIAELLKDPVYQNDPEVNYQLAVLWEDERLYDSSGIGAIDTELVIDCYKKVLQFSDPQKHKAIIENAKLAIKRLEKEAAIKKTETPSVDKDEVFALAVLSARMDAAQRFEDFMGSTASAAELNCLLTDYRQIVNFCTFFHRETGELADREKQCKDKISLIKEKLENEDHEPGRDTRILQAYRGYLGIGRPQAPMYDVFISCKSKDQKYAQCVYDFLLLKGKRPFFSKETISAQGNSEYHDAIMEALDHSKHFILVSSRLDYVNSTWVKHEWSTYVGEAIEGRKNGNMILVFHEDFHFKKTELPIDIRRKEILSLSSFRDRLMDYLD